MEQPRPASDCAGSDVAREILRDLADEAPARSGEGASLALIGNRYEVLQPLGHGGMGAVYRVRDRVLGREVALKVLRFGVAVASEAVDRFQREARAAAALEHANIVRVHDVGTLPDGAPFYTMEVLEGEDLAHAIHGGRLAPRAAVEATRQVALALLHAHQKGILHRDIKPQNIWLKAQPPPISSPDAPTVSVRGPDDSEVHALLLDFGLARIAQHDLASHAAGSAARRSVQTLTRSGQIMGTPAYMAPEQARGAHEVDARADVYGLGATLYHALAGRTPFEAATLASLLEQVQKADPPPPSRANRDLDADLDTLCLKCLQKDPKDRYQSAAEIAEDCRRYLAGEPLVARPLGTAARLWRRAKRNRAVAIPVAAATLMTLAVLGLWGGDALARRIQASTSLDEARTLLRAGRHKEALDKGLEARAFAPTSGEVRSVLAQICCTWGQAAAAEYRRVRDEAARLAQEADQAKTPSTPAELDEARRVRGTREESLRAAQEGRGTWWSTAVLKFQEALTHVEDHVESKAALTELYWDELMRAERDRDEANAARYRKLVSEVGGEEGKRRVMGEMDVEVAFHLPASFEGVSLGAWLYRYERNADPAVLAPVPCAPRTGTPLGAPELGSWKRVPLAEATTTAARARSGSAFPLRRMEANHVELVISAASPRVARFEARLPRASYLILIPGGQGVIEARYPFEVARETPWVETCELVAEEPPLPPMPPVEERYWVYVPAGPYRASGDPGAQQSPPRSAARLRVPREGNHGYFLARFEVTSAMYARYLDDAAWHGDKGALRHAPRPVDTPIEEQAWWTRDGAGHWRPQPMLVWWTDDVPVCSISFFDAEDYCRWLTAGIGGGAWDFVLPDEDEWEKAARGADGRYFPWGDTFDPTFCRMQASRPGEQETLAPEPTGLFPLDESPFGLRNMAGGIGEWTRSVVGPSGEWRVFKGGAWGSPPSVCRPAWRMDPEPYLVNSSNGFRVLARRRR